jgi:alpha-L-rhamnosidase
MTFASTALLLLGLAQGAPLAPAGLRCEYATDPLGLDARRPRFSWEVSDPRRGAEQSAYEIDVAEEPGKVLWQSGKVLSRETCQVEYAGSPLESFHRYAWKVRTFDAEGHASPWSASASFGTAALDPAEWKASWIGDPAPAPRAVPARNGYHSTFAKEEDAQKWIQLDLGGHDLFNTIRLYPARPYDAPDPSGFLFPKKLKIWASDKPGFDDAYFKIVDETFREIPNPGTEPYSMKTTSTKYNMRYVRIGVTQMGHVEGKGYAFALAEVQVLDGDRLVSKGAHVTAGDSIETGEWSTANLIDGDLASHGPSGYDPLAPPILRKEFALSSPATRATIFASALGLFEIRINGKRVGADELAPGWTDYSTRAPFLAYDVTGLLRAGPNAIAVQLADGWYSGRLGLSFIVPGGPPRGIYGRKPRFLAQLSIEHEGGARETVATDATWTSTTAGPVRAADLLDGEVYDARTEIPGLDSPGFASASWKPVEVAADLHPHLDALACEPSKIVQTLKPVSMKEPKPGVYVFDLGQNMVGWCRFRLAAPAGTEVVLRHAEMAEPDGSIYTANLRSAQQTDRYLCSGKGAEIFEPRFTYHGFRYVEVSGLPSKPALEDLEGCVVSNSARDAGTFRASDPLLERLWTNARWTLRGNLLSVPTDCPQRDERLGWMGDIAAFAQTAAFQQDLAGFFPKWLRDVRDAQADDGRFPDFAPHPYGKNVRFTGTPAWGDAGVVVPWVAWVNYGDKRLLESHLDAMLRWLEWIRSKNPDLVWRNDRGNDYGDWLNGDTLVREGWPKEGAATPGEVLATAMFARSAALVARMAAVVGRAEDAKKCADLAVGIRAAFRKAFVGEDGSLTTATQGACALALASGALEPPQQDRALDALVRSIDGAYAGHLSTGFTSTLPALMELSNRGRADLATKLALDHRFPSWGYAVDNGATTLWERWDGFVPERGLQDSGMNSFNHYAFGAIGEWMVRAAAGIEPDEEHPAWSHFRVHPRAGPALTSAAATLDTIRGRISSTWSRTGDAFDLEVSIPPNTSATVTLPAKDPASVTEGGNRIPAVSTGNGEAVLELRAGTYHLRSRP